MICLQVGPGASRIVLTTAVQSFGIVMLSLSA